MSQRFLRRRRAWLLSLAAVLTACPLEGCWSSELAKRFREEFVPGFVEGLAQAVTFEGNTAEPGLRRAWAAFFEGLGAALNTRDGS